MGATLMDATGLHRTVIRLSHEIGERNKGFSDVVLIGVKKNGGIVARRIQNYIRDTEGFDLPCAEIDPNMQEIRLDFSIEGKTVVLCDDVLHTGKSVVKGVTCCSSSADRKKFSCSCLSTGAEGNCLSAPISWVKTFPLPKKNTSR